MIFQVTFHKDKVPYLQQHIGGMIVSCEPFAGNPDLYVVSIQIQYSSELASLFYAGVMCGIDLMFIKSNNIEQ